MHKTAPALALLLSAYLVACDDSTDPAQPSPGLIAPPTPPASAGASTSDPPAPPPCQPPEPFASAQGDVKDTAVDATHVYWTVDPSKGKGQVLAAAKAGGAPRALAEGLDHPMGVVADEARVYWVTYSGGVWSAPKEGGEPRQHHHDSSSIAARGVAVDTTHLYWTSTHGVVALPKEASPGDEPTPMIPDAGGSLALSDGYLYATSKRALWRVRLGADQAPQLLTEGLTSIDALAVRGATAYVVDVTAPGVGRLLAIPVGGGAPAVLAGKLDVPSSPGVDADDEHVYVTTLAELARVPRSGGPREGLFCQGGAALRLDSDAAYWAGLTGRGLYRGDK